ncbi:hypothetical protein KsCSTR_10180 [Candidatus Kuenenia stuttgartiensis]|uniref:Uncharacterized protein n=1 Tax=Kuenenia stuttgartiensis TaxID=174633 RepID=Q1PYS5_KUEST|nr:hypothetical protein KsCSTR_10180 [Candidatus Kuenenia stuttgartiensis]CAJ72240.1 unknown protein [Candidatus Kuenenia stuttgartiensis]
MFSTRFGNEYFCFLKKLKCYICLEFQIILSLEFVSCFVFRAWERAFLNARKKPFF